MTNTRRLVPALIMGGLLALTACATGTDGNGIASADGGTATDDPTPTSTLSSQEKALAFVQCMRDHGVDMEDPQFDGGGTSIRIGGEGVDPGEVEAATEACREFAPFGGDDRPPPDPEMEAKMLQFAQCMRDNGVPDFRDPEGTSMSIDEKVGSDPDFPAAQELCQKQFLPDLPPPNTAGGGPGSGGGPGGGSVVGGDGGGRTT